MGNSCKVCLDMNLRQPWEADWQAFARIPRKFVASSSFKLVGVSCCQGLVIFMIGSGVMTRNSLRYARMLTGMNYIVILPDLMAHGRFRRRDLSPLLMSCALLCR